MISEAFVAFGRIQVRRAAESCSVCLCVHVCVCGVHAYVCACRMCVCVCLWCV